MIATYAAVLAVGGASLAIGQAAISLCGPRRWSWLAPAVGLALVLAICWATVRLPGEGVVSAATVLVLAVAAALYLRGRLEGGRRAFRSGLPVAGIAFVAASLPFAVEGHFGILGTGFNPDMSQHLLAADRLAAGAEGELLRDGYPLGPHAVAVALEKGLGIGLVQAFSGLTVAVAILAPLTALAAFSDRPPVRRTAAALLVGVPYLVASFYAQGAFKETIQALIVLAFVLALRESTRTWHSHHLRLVPAALIAIGTVYAYSFPGLAWLAATAGAWAIAEWARARSVPPAGGVGVGVSGEARRPVFRPTSSTSSKGAPGEKPSAKADTPTPPTGPAGGGASSSTKADTPTAATGPAGLRAWSLAAIVFAIGTLPELGRMLDFQSFETFDPAGPGLGNLFGQVSPFTALGVWPSGDFRVAPGDGAVPAIVFYLGAAFGTLLLLIGVARCRRRGEGALLAGLLAAAAVYAAARIGGTAYTAAKALEVAAPLASLTIVAGLLGAASASPRRFRGTALAPDAGSAWFRGTALVAYGLIAAGCSLLAFANAPVGPTSYSPALTGLRPLLAGGSTLVLAPGQLLEQEHGARYIAWELRGGRVCIEPEVAAGGAPPAGVRFFVTSGPPERPPFDRLTFSRRAGPYTVWERRGVLGGPSPCPLVDVRQAVPPAD